MIRTMVPDDLERVAELERLCFEEAWSQESIEFELKDNRFCRPLVLEEDGRILGFAFLWVMFEQASLADIGIDPAFRKQGYGRILMDALLNTAREAGCESMTLEVRPSNTGAIALYERCGFTLLNRVKGYYSNGEDALLMGTGI